MAKFWVDSHNVFTSGADLGPNDIRIMLASVPFQIGTSTSSVPPSSVEIVTFFFTEVIDSMEHMKMSATMNTARKL